MNRSVIPYARQTIDEEDIKAVTEVLKGDYLTTGPKVAEFEQAFAAWVGAKYAVAVSSGTAALHLACLAAGINPGDEVIVTPMSFAASANCVLYAGARPVFADIESTGNIDPSQVEQAVTSSTKAVIPVHYGGLPFRMEEISRTAQKHGLTVVEDACHALLPPRVVGAGYSMARLRLRFGGGKAASSARSSSAVSRMSRAAA
ncbi:MAG TPA: aminotransferase class I/II-fold pyridoxal phosphate-dependent enzyme, partial [Syntrophothermus lipocalidus]|nr:aminotransferase class I/II-fold pyridoxal phosphate-dependent enzyme [Syntrophothermus lipocalidus]